MKNFQTQAPILLCFILLLVSCRKEEPIPIEQVIPLQVGNEWVYKVTDYDSNGNIASISESRTLVSRDTLINKSTWYILNEKSIVQHNSSGYVYFNKNNKSGDRSVIIYPSSSQGNIGYIYEYPNYNLWVRTKRLPQLSPIDGAIDNLSGYTFEIKREHYQPNNNTTFTFRQTDYVNPKVGLVRSDKYYIDSDKLMRRADLIRYTLK